MEQDLVSIDDVKPEICLCFESKEVTFRQSILYTPGSGADTIFVEML